MGFISELPVVKNGLAALLAQVRFMGQLMSIMKLCHKGHKGHKALCYKALC